MIRHPGASLAVPITADGHVVLLRQYRFAVQARLLEFPASTLEEGEDPLESMQRELGKRPATARPAGIPWARCCLAPVT